jgi:succinate dehydrogenase flavin-adding protein (antitoxin of CptAB toxin-antitoxin module)
MKQNFLRVAQALITQGEPDKAAQVMDTCLYYFPANKIHYDIIMMPFIEIYYDAGRQETANEEVRKMMKVCDDELTYILSLDPLFADTYYSTQMQQHMAVLQRMVEVTKNKGEEELSEEVQAVLTKHSAAMQ